MQNRDLNKAYLEEKSYGKLRRLFCILEKYTRESRFGGAKSPCIKYVALPQQAKPPQLIAISHFLVELGVNV